MDDERFDDVEQLAELAEAHGHTLPELALSWLAGNPIVSSVIAGATTDGITRATGS
jgi:aryl-alcohol dehydrogenase-like predicted oxidoreductase